MENKELQTWIIRSSKQIIESPWMNIRADVCETADGLVIDPFYVMESSDWVHIVPFDNEGRLLVTRQYRHGNRDIQWEIPCGCVDGDESPLAAAKRELKEETGCVADSYRELPTVFANPARQDNRIHAFVASGVAIQGKQQLDTTEEIQFEFMEVATAMDHIRGGRFQNALLVASLMMALSEQFQDSPPVS